MIASRPPSKYGGANAASSAVSMLYAYAADGDMTQLSYDLASRPGDPVTFDFTNDGAGRLTSETISDPAWMWQPTTERNVTYDAANTLDQLTGFTRIEGVAAPEVSPACSAGHRHHRCNLAHSPSLGRCSASPCWCAVLWGRRP